jgi:hypothetical protein
MLPMPLVMVWNGFCCSLRAGAEFARDIDKKGIFSYHEENFGLGKTAGAKAGGFLGSQQLPLQRNMQNKNKER